MSGYLLLQADARRLPVADGSVHCVVTDPPYGQTNEDYDSPICFDPAVWRECYRVTKPNAVLVSFAGSPTYHRIASAIEAAGWRVRQMWGWIYRDGFITSAWPKEGFDRLAPAMDPIVFATKGKVLLGLEREGENAWHRSNRGEQRYSERASSHGKHEAVGRWPRSIVSDGASPFEYFAAPRAQRYRQSDHPNEKPLALMEWIISKLPGEIVLDPFCGSATTVIAANALGRRGIGTDLSREYLGLARHRITRPHARVPRPAHAEHHPLFDGA